jgi:hypothetical protein
MFIENAIEIRTGEGTPGAQPGAYLGESRSYLGRYEVFAYDLHVGGRRQVGEKRVVRIT